MLREFTYEAGHNQCCVVLSKCGAEEEGDEYDVGTEISEEGYIVSTTCLTGIRFNGTDIRGSIYPGMRPLASVNGTNIKGHTAAPMFQLTVAQIELSKGAVRMLNCEL